MVEKVIVWIFLVWGSIGDIRRKYISIRYLWLFGFVGLVCMVFELIKDKDIGEIVIAIFPGIIFIFLSYITREQIGMGDGMVILCTGFFLSLQEMIYVIFIAFLFLTIVSVVLYVSCKANKKIQIPFLPFWLLGFTIFMLGEIL